LNTNKPKLIEVALPLAAINEACAHEKAVKHGHPSNLHLWWARRPLAAARAVIWASLVDDPSGDPTLTPEQQETERLRLFGILERLVKWENSNNPDVLAAAKAEIDRCFPDGAPSILDPFGGGGAIPLEAQRLGLNALSGDLNPVAVLIQKAMLEIPPRFAGRRPVHPDIDSTLDTWERSQGMAADIEAYGRWMRDEAFKRIGHLYPDATGPNGEKLTPIAWIWARTVESPDPTWDGHVPLVTSWTLARRPGKPKVWIEPIINRDTQTITYEVRHGGEPCFDRTVSNGDGTCIATGAAIRGDYIKAESRAGRMGQQLMAVVAEGTHGRQYCRPDQEQVARAVAAGTSWRPVGSLPAKGLGFRVPAYGLDEWWKLFTPRQLTALTTFSDLLPAVHQRVTAEAISSGWAEDGARLRDGGDSATSYADAIVTYLAFVIDKLADLGNSLVRWEPVAQCPRQLFGRQAVSMVWDFAEGNPLGSRSGSFEVLLEGQKRVLMGNGFADFTGPAEIVQRDARARVVENPGVVISTDPPYYDNVGYADLSDFFFVWLRRNLSAVWPDECATLKTPKKEELIADPGRHGGRLGAEVHFESGMAEFMADVATAQHPAVPATIYYAYKATESKDGAVRSTGWDTFLQAVLDAGLQVTATWPVRTENASRLRAIKANALASSVVLVCRPRSVTAPLATRGEFMGALRAELPEAVRLLQSGNIAPVDLAQSTIGPGIGVFSRYAKVVEADGSTMTVSDALALINDVLADVIDGEEAELDADTRFAVTWYSQFGYNPSKSGDADGQARAKNTSLAGVTDAGIGESHGGEFRLFERNELDPGWSPVDDDRLTVWEVTQYLVAALERSESEAAGLLQLLGGFGERARALAYVLFQRATDKGWAEEAGAYNSLITAWPVLQSFQQAQPEDGQQQLI
jgi:putative DNA methylase